MKRILFIGAPGAGKSTIMYGAFSKLKQEGIQIKIVPDVGRLKWVDTARMPFAHSKRFISEAVYALYLARLLNEIEQSNLCPDGFEYRYLFVDENILAEWAMAEVLQIEGAYREIMRLQVEKSFEYYDRIYFLPKTHRVKDEYHGEVARLLGEALRDAPNVIELDAPEKTTIARVVDELRDFRPVSSTPDTAARRTSASRDDPRSSGSTDHLHSFLR